MNNDALALPRQSTYAKAGASERSWFAALTAVSALLLIATFVPYVLPVGAPAAGLFFWLGFNDQNNVGDWWSSMLGLLAALMAFDGYFDTRRPPHERRGWCAVAFVMLMFSFEEVAAFHDYLGRRHDGSPLLLAALAAGCAAYGLAQLRATLPPQKIALLLVGFAALALAPLLEDFSVLPGHRAVYGAFTVFEEGAEVSALLLFLLAARGNTEALLRTGLGPFAAAARSRRSIVVAGLLLWPLLTAATFVLTSRTGAADWLAAALALLCAVLVVRRSLQRGGIDARRGLSVLLLLGLSLAANAVRIGWIPNVLGIEVSLRGAALALLVPIAAGALQWGGRRVDVSRTVLGAAVIGGCAIAWPSSQLLWSAVPPLFTLTLYALVSAGPRARVPRRRSRPA